MKAKDFATLETPILLAFPVYSCNCFLGHEVGHPQ